MAKMKIGIVGCGNIAADICIAIRDKEIPAEVVALTDIDAAKADALRQEFGLQAEIGTLDETVSKVDYVAECAVASVVADVLLASIRHHVDCLIMSVGGLMAQPERWMWQKNRVHVVSHGCHLRLTAYVLRWQVLIQ